MYLIKLIRLNHWVKNLFIFMPLFFNGNIYEIDSFFKTLQIFFGFSFITSSVYIINDLFDKEHDKTHPIKKFRPIASNQISITFSVFISIIMFFLGSSLIKSLSLNCLLYSLVYLLINIFYSYKLKNIPIIDFVIISIGFVIRILLGGEINSIELSSWIIIMVLLVSILIAVSKRRDDVYYYEKHNLTYRSVVSKYNLIFIDKIITIISSVLLVSYLLFITSAETLLKYNSPKLLTCTFLIVIIGVFRFNQLTYVYKRSGSPIQIFFKDVYTQIILLIWILLYIYIIYKPFSFE